MAGFCFLPRRYWCGDHEVQEHQPSRDPDSYRARRKQRAEGIGGRDDVPLKTEEGRDNGVSKILSPARGGTGNEGLWVHRNED